MNGFDESASSAGVPSAERGPGEVAVQPPRNQHRQAKRVAAGCATVATVVLVLICLGVGWIVVQCQQATEETDQVAGVFLAALSDGDDAQAYDLLCDGLKQTTPFDEFRDRMADASELLRGYQGRTIVGTELNYYNNAPRVLAYEAIVTVADAGPAVFDAAFVDVGAGWCIAGFNISW